MALFQHGNRSIFYRIDFAPFDFDLVLLQGSRFTPDFWRPILDSFSERPNGSGRIMVCEWFDSQSEASHLTHDFTKLLLTLGLDSCHVIAFDESVAMVNEAQRLHPGLFTKTLLFPVNGPKGAELERKVSEFCGI